MKTTTATNKKENPRGPGKVLTPNQVVANVEKRLKELNAASGGMSDGYDYNEEKQILNWLEKEVRVTGFTSVLSKKAIIQLIRIQQRTRFMAEHRFYMLFTKDED